MKKPIQFNHNIEMLRDIADTIGTGKMANAYDNLSFGVNDNNRIVVRIESRTYNTDTHNYDRNYVCVEYQGDGVCCIEPTDSCGNPIDDTWSGEKLYDTHWSHPGKTTQEVFKEKLKKFGIRL